MPRRESNDRMSSGERAWWPVRLKLAGDKAWIQRWGFRITQRMNSGGHRMDAMPGCGFAGGEAAACETRNFSLEGAAKFVGQGPKDAAWTFCSAFARFLQVL